MSDALAKSFYQSVLVAVPSEERVLRKQFREAGVLDFVNVERPETEDPGELAAAAVLYLGIGSHGEFGPLGQKVVQASIAFMGKHHPKRPTAEKVARLGLILEENPINPGRLRAWFQSTYPTDR